MATTDAELTRITQALNRIETAGAARLAIGETLNAVGRAYDAARAIDNGELRDSYIGQLDTARANLERAFHAIRATGNQDYRSEWRRPGLGGFDLCKRAYVVIAGAEASAAWVPRTSNLDILEQSLREAPGVFGEGVGAIVGGAADAVGQAVSGVATGLGLRGFALVAVIVAVVALVVTKGGVIGGARRLVAEVGKAVAA